jgi:hypothetical protein
MLKNTLKTTGFITLALLTVVLVTSPSAYADKNCVTPTECLEKAIEQLQQAQKIILAANSWRCMSELTIYAQLEASSQTFAANSWTGIKWTSLPIFEGISVFGENLKFSKAGVYRITLSYRTGNAGNVWTAVRLFGDGSSRGHSAGFGNLPYDPALHTVSFLAEVVNSSATYQIQIGRLSSPLTPINPASISGESLPALQASIEKIN